MIEKDASDCMEKRLVNIPRSLEDPYYRYKMPPIEIKLEGRGNGIKTKLTNISEISESLLRPPLYIVKFFGYELGSQTGAKEGFLINGKHEPEDLSNILDKFIEKYVLCGTCRNPETVLFISNKGVPRMKCKACGAITECDLSHKISNYIIKFPPEPKEIPKIEEKEDPSPKKIIDEEDWAVSTLPDDVAKRRVALAGRSLSILEDYDQKIMRSLSENKSQNSPNLKKINPTENPLVHLASYWAELPEESSVVGDIHSVANRCGWSDEAMLKNVFGSMWFPFTPEGAIPKAAYLGLLVDGNEVKQKQILSYMEKMATDNKQFADRFQDLLVLFWENNVLDEDTIKKWYSHSNPKTPEKVSKYIREKCTQAIKWLEQPANED